MLNKTWLDDRLFKTVHMCSFTVIWLQLVPSNIVYMLDTKCLLESEKILLFFQNKCVFYYIVPSVIISNVHVPGNTTGHQLFMSIGVYGVVTTYYKYLEVIYLINVWFKWFLAKRSKLCIINFRSKLTFIFISIMLY